MPNNSKRKTQHGSRVRDAGESAREYFDTTRERAYDYVRDHPLQAVIIAAGVGALVATGVTALLTRPRERSLFDRLLDFF
jgi:ElaB/YqjD/DUF883 family membrane-anchored ribosome-binding protein